MLRTPDPLVDLHPVLEVSAMNAILDACDHPADAYQSVPGDNGEVVIEVVCRKCADRAVEAAVLAAKQWTDEDQPLPEDDAIHAAHPTRTGQHELYAEAMRLVGAKRSKYALVDLVNWLLAEKEAATLTDRAALLKYVLAQRGAVHGSDGVAAGFDRACEDIAAAIRARGGIGPTIGPPQPDTGSAQDANPRRRGGK